LIGCRIASEESKKYVPYTGPILTMYDVNMYFSDSAQVKINLRAPKQEEYLNGDRVFPDGVEIDFYEKTGEISSTLRANEGEYTKVTNVYKVKGNVVITGVKDVKTLETEELEWLPYHKKVKSDKFVKIKTKEEILTGNGLDAAQDFSYYKILKPSGIFYIK
jgi:LPS export ABC transporter protein LptC